MSFLAPYWLLALLPWAGLALWLMLGRRPRADVPFLELWRGPHAGRPRRRSVQPPPPAVLAALLALLLMVLAAARPVFRTERANEGVPLAILIDRGLTMSARGQRDFRYREMAARLEQALAGMGWAPRIEMRAVPASVSGAGENWRAFVDALPPTAVDTRSAIEQAVAQHRARQAGPLLIITDHPPAAGDSRVVRIAPDTLPANAGIVALSARTSPASQVMLRLRNDSPQSSAAIRLFSDGQVVARSDVELPPRGSERDIFLDVPLPGRSLRAELQVSDDLDADNVAHLVRRGAWPEVEVRSPVPVELQRFLDRYRALRPPAEGSKRVVVVNSLDSLPLGEPGAAVQVAATGETPAGADAPLTIANHPLMAGLEGWSPPPLSAPAAPVEPSWVSVARSGDRVLLAVREQPVRQVWTGMHSERFATTPQFVILWTNILDWLGQGGELFHAQGVGALGGGWSEAEEAPVPAGVPPGLWPGLYRRSDGALLAVNAPAAPPPAPPASDWKRELARLAEMQPLASRDRPFAGACLLLALALLLLATLLLRPR